MKIALVFSGASTKIALHAGFLKALDECNIVADKIYGTSAGAIIAGLMAAGYDYKEIEDILLSTEFNSFLKQNYFSYVFNILFRNSLYSSDKLEKYLHKLFKEKNLRDIKKEVFIYAHNVEKGFCDIFNKKDHGWLPLSKVVTASLSIPFMFQPTLINGKYYVDGGLSKNFPIDDVNEDDKHYGHVIMTKSNISYKNLNHLNYAKSLIYQTLEANTKESIRDRDPNGILVYSYSPIPFYQFNITKKQKQEMIDYAYNKTKTTLFGKSS